MKAVWLVKGSCSRLFGMWIHILIVVCCSEDCILAGFLGGLGGVEWKWGELFLVLIVVAV